MSSKLKRHFQHALNMGASGDGWYCSVLWEYSLFTRNVDDVTCTRCKRKLNSLGIETHDTAADS